MKEEDVKQVTVISGKGGTGKSTIIAALASYLKEHIILADADVDAADLYLIFTPEETESFDYHGLKKAYVDKEICTDCGECRARCRFGAVTEEHTIDPTKCEGCSLCYHACPVSAITMNDVVSGQYFVSKTRIGEMVHARLSPGEESSGLLVAEVRKIAKTVAAKNDKKLVIIDGSPGIGCPVISSLIGTNFAIVVAEPTISGYHDLDRILQLLKEFKIPGLIIINRSDINEEFSQKIQEDFHDSFPVIGKIPYNPIFVKAMLEKKSIMEMVSEDKNVLAIQDMIKGFGNLIMEKFRFDN
ncbi:MAG: (4Fe-4S)-binding protein [Candidatus Heimdallarchaeota archaeon]|nr:(4Fe-4S)-binding protein [Candidatus Heimdallarchaeota archaeon]